MAPKDSTIKLKIIIIGDSASGKSKLIDRYINDGYINYNSSTNGCSIYEITRIDSKTHKSINITIMDTAGQDRYSDIHPSYYHGAHGCIMVFDLGRKSTYKNLEKWDMELKETRPDIPLIVLANKIDEYPEMATKQFVFAKDKQGFYFTSAKDGTNVVAAFEKIIELSVEYAADTKEDDILGLLHDKHIWEK